MQVQKIYLPRLSGVYIYEVKMTKQAIIRKIIIDKALVEIIEDAEKCNFKCEGCELKNKLLLSDLNIPVKENDVVEIYIENYKLFISTFVTFILPLILLIFGLFLGRGNEIKSLLFGGIFVAIALIFAYIFDKYFKAKVTITKVMFEGG